MKHTFEVTMTVELDADDCAQAEEEVQAIVLGIGGVGGLHIVKDSLMVSEELHDDEALELAEDDGADAAYDTMMQDEMENA
jgi:hypothetical protein